MGAEICWDFQKEQLQEPNSPVSWPESLHLYLLVGSMLASCVTLKNDLNLSEKLGLYFINMLLSAQNEDSAIGTPQLLLVFLLFTHSFGLSSRFVTKFLAIHKLPPALLPNIFTSTFFPFIDQLYALSIASRSEERAFLYKCFIMCPQTMAIKMLR